MIWITGIGIFLLVFAALFKGWMDAAVEMPEEDWRRDLPDGPAVEYEGPGGRDGRPAA